jgi:hypothetical protein
MALKEFSVSNRWWDDLFGGGHTVATDPAKRGWRAALAAPGSGVLVVGRRGVAGCMSVMQLSGGRLDVAVYDDVTPESLAASARTRCPAADVIRQVEAIPGWSLPFIEMIENG